MPGLIFDYDGLMVDSERVLAEHIIEAVGALGGTVAIADFGHLFGSTDLDHEWDRLLPQWCGRPVTLADLDARLWPGVSDINDTLPLLPGVVELLDAARALEFAVGLATGQSSKERLASRLQRNAVYERFDAIVTRSEVERGKPEPDLFLEVARRLDVVPGECVVLEDSVPGCDAALAAGMRVIACPSAASAHCEFPDRVRRVTSLLDVTADDLANALR